MNLKVMSNIMVNTIMNYQYLLYSIKHNRFLLKSDNLAYIVMTKTLIFNKDPAFICKINYDMLDNVSNYSMSQLPNYGTVIQTDINPIFVQKNDLILNKIINNDLFHLTMFIDIVYKVVSNVLGQSATVNQHILSKDSTVNIVSNRLKQILGPIQIINEIDNTFANYRVQNIDHVNNLMLQSCVSSRSRSALNAKLKELDKQYQCVTWII